MSAKKTNSVDFTYLGDKKVEKGKKQLIEESAAWKKPAHKERQEQQKEVIKKVKKAQAQVHDKVSWKKRMGGIVAILFLCGVGLFQFIMQVSNVIMGSGVSVLDVQDTATLKRVLFGGDPWLIYCVDNVTESQKLPQVLTESSWSVKRSTGLRMGTLRCWETTESGRSVAQRFKMKLKPPLTFVVANGNKPRALNLVGISKPEDLEKRVKPALTLEIKRIGTLKSWPTLCTSRRACVVIGHRQTAQRDTATTLLKPLQESHRGVQVVTLDTSFWQLKLDPVLMATRPGAGGEGSKRADILCLGRKDGSANATYLGRFLDSLDSSAASDLMTACGQQSGLVEMKEAPKIKARPAKPKKAAPTTPRPAAPRPSPPAARPKEKKTNVDHVGSREKMEREEEELFEAVDEGAEEEESEQEAEEDDGDEVEL